MSDVLDLVILDSGSDDHAVAVARAGSDCAIARLPFGDDLEQLTTFRDWIESAVRGSKTAPTKAELAAFGERLFAFTFRDEIGDLYGRLPTDDIRLQLLSDRPEIQNLPWEYLQVPKKRRGPDRGQCVVRLVATIGSPLPQPPPVSAQVRVLFVSAAPTDQGSVTWEEVKGAVQRAFEVNLPEAVAITLVDGADPKALRQAIANNEFDIFHFSGHGRVANGQGELVMVNRKSQKSEYLDAEKVCAVLAGRGLRLVVLSACQTSSGDFRDDFSVMAAALVRAGIPAVVANQMPVSNKTMSPFVGQLYTSLLKTGDIDRAMTEGRIALYTDLATNASSGLEWGIPTLYRHYHGARVYTV